MNKTIASILGIGIGVAASTYSRSMNKKSMKKWQKKLRKAIH
ncbi:DUF3918 family protein [Mangrovibacillus cuniculi]|uniref:DUF3918 family protein n=1 Tax=Mangrovibacillus cuniculi TaxID=2593652 RepID=A0A7S8CBM8_9BACI|nr:DUF3918 family protein [Mangrovibacillus cuniculi]QPC46995.1 DUF3918 family protein [Mangrovibacillus cuniculi]